MWFIYLGCVNGQVFLSGQFCPIFSYQPCVVFSLLFTQIFINVGLTLANLNKHHMILVNICLYIFTNKNVSSIINQRFYS